jgi:hypothetical protein
MTDVPVTRTLTEVLRDALAVDPGALSLITCKDATGAVAYVLAAPGRMLYLGTVTGHINVVINGVTISVPKLI